MKIAIIGGGLAGCALAYALRQAGQDPVVYEAGTEIASGPSGNSVGLYNPRFCALRGAESDYYTSAFSMALRTFGALGDVDWDACGTLDLINDEKRAKRFTQTVENWGWDPEHMRIVDSAEASDIAGIDLNHEALYLPQSGSVSPRKLCLAYMKDVDFHLNAPVNDLDEIDADVKILACGPAVRQFAPDLTITGVRGQITDVKASQLSQDVKCTICYGGYFSPARDGQHIVGSTFQRVFDDVGVVDEDDRENVQKLADHIPGLEQGLEIIGSRASVRATSKDYFPIVGALDDGVYVSTAHGSHGILSSLMAAHLLVDMILGRPLCLGGQSVAALSPVRFK